MGVEVVEGMEWLLWLIKKTAWLLEPWGKTLVVVIIFACLVEFCIWRPRRK
jgi:hypothetical protein